MKFGFLVPASQGVFASLSEYRLSPAPRLGSGGMGVVTPLSAGYWPEFIDSSVLRRRLQIAAAKGIPYIIQRIGIRNADIRRPARVVFHERNLYLRYIVALMFTFDGFNISEAFSGCQRPDARKVFSGSRRVVAPWREAFPPRLSSHATPQRRNVLLVVPSIAAHPITVVTPG